jgi:hypothetical protein
VLVTVVLLMYRDGAAGLADRATGVLELNGGVRDAEAVLQ